MNPARLGILTAIVFLFYACQLTPEKDVTVLPDSSGSERFNDLSPQRVAELNRALVGREFVFRVDWFMHYIVNENALVNRYFEPGKKTKRWGRVPAHAGTVAKVTGLNTAGNHIVVVLFEDENGNEGSIWVSASKPCSPSVPGCYKRWQDNWSAKLPSELNDDTVNVSWLRDVLSRRAVEFVRPESAQDVTLPRAKEGLVLTPPPGEAKPKAPSSPQQPVIHELNASAEPARVQRGGEVRLMLSFTVVAEGMPKAEVEEKRTLEFNGSALPKFPVTRTLARPAGKHTSTYRQKIPKSAKPGTYTFRGEVCIQRACSSHSAQFELRP